MRVVVTACKQREIDFRASNSLKGDTAFHLMHLLHHLSGVVFQSADIYSGEEPVLNPALLDHLSRIKSAGAHPFRLFIRHAGIRGSLDVNIDAALAAMQQLLHVHATYFWMQTEEQARQVLSIVSGRGQSTVEIRRMRVYLWLQADFVDRLIEVGVLAR